MQAERELHIQVPFVRMLPQCALCPHCGYTLFIIYKRQTGGALRLLRTRVHEGWKSEWKTCRISATQPKSCIISKLTTGSSPTKLESCARVRICPSLWLCCALVKGWEWTSNAPFIWCACPKTVMQTWKLTNNESSNREIFAPLCLAFLASCLKLFPLIYR